MYSKNNCEIIQQFMETLSKDLKFDYDLVIDYENNYIKSLTVNTKNAAVSKEISYTFNKRSFGPILQSISEIFNLTLNIVYKTLKSSNAIMQINKKQITIFRTTIHNTYKRKVSDLGPTISNIEAEHLQLLLIEYF